MSQLFDNCCTTLSFLLWQAVVENKGEKKDDGGENYDVGDNFWTEHEVVEHPGSPITNNEPARHCGVHLMGDKKISVNILLLLS